MEVRCPSESCKQPDHRVHRVPCSRQGLGVSTGSSGVSPPAVSHRISPVASSSRELSASFRVLRPTTCPAYPEQPCDHPEAVERLPWGSRPSSRHQPAASTSARSPNPRAMVRPRRFSRPRRFAPPPALRVCFAPQPRPGFALQGFVPPAEPYRVSPADSCPRAVERTRLRFDPRQLTRPRLQGLAPRESPVSRRRNYLQPDPRPS